MAVKRKSRRRVGIKIHRNYTVDEVSRALDVAPITVRRWLKAGLPALTERKPALILGADVIEYLDARRTPATRCQPNECYCVKCRVPRVPAGLMAEYVPITATTGNLRGLCPECGTLMHKRVAVASIPALRQFFDLTIMKEAPPITGRDKACLNDNLERDVKNHA